MAANKHGKGKRGGDGGTRDDRYHRMHARSRRIVRRARSGRSRNGVERFRTRRFVRAVEPRRGERVRQSSSDLLRWCLGLRRPALVLAPLACGPSTLRSRRRHDLVLASGASDCGAACALRDSIRRRFQPGPRTNERAERKIGCEPFRDFADTGRHPSRTFRHRVVAAWRWRKLQNVRQPDGPTRRDRLSGFLCFAPQPFPPGPALRRIPQQHDPPGTHANS